MVTIPATPAAIIPVTPPPATPATPPPATPPAVSGGPVTPGTLNAHLLSLAANTATSPHNIRIDVSNAAEFNAIKTALTGNPDKYVNLDLSGSTVTSIPTTAFSNPSCTGLVGITLPDSITSIGTNAFYGCTNLAVIIIPNNVATISNNAFAGCSGLTSVTIGNGVRTISLGAFSNANALTRVTFVAGGIVSSISSTAFAGDLGQKYAANGGGPGTYTRPAGGTTWTKQR
jgi:hypothetical protein